MPLAELVAVIVDDCIGLKDDLREAIRLPVIMPVAVPEPDVVDVPESTAVLDDDSLLAAVIFED